MTLTADTKLGPYEIAAPLGAGGMGEVNVAFACSRACLRHRLAARVDARSTASLARSLRSGSRGANLLPPFGRETFRAASDGGRLANIGRHRRWERLK